MKRLFVLTSFILPLFFISGLTSCGRSCYDPYYCGPGVSRPVVAVLPTIDRTEGGQVSWNLSQEFTQEIQKHLFTSPHVYFMRSTPSQNTAYALNCPDPKLITKSDVECLGAAEFAIVTELLAHEEEFFEKAVAKMSQLGGIGGKLSASVRLRVLDLRGQKPRVILQELIDAEQAIPMHCCSSDYIPKEWQGEGFGQTPMGQLHDALIGQIVGRAESYIGAMRS